jgi:hypothetical protein
MFTLARAIWLFEFLLPLQMAPVNQAAQKLKLSGFSIENVLIQTTCKIKYDTLYVSHVYVTAH